MAQGGGGDGVATMTEMNRLIRLHWWWAAVASLARRCGEVERASGSESGRVDGVVGTWCLSACLGLTDKDNTGMLPPHGGHDATRECGSDTAIID